MVKSKVNLLIILTIARIIIYIIKMDNLQPIQDIYAEFGYKEYEKYFLHHATVSMLNIYN